MPEKKVKDIKYYTALRDLQYNQPLMYELETYRNTVAKQAMNPGESIERIRLLQGKFEVLNHLLILITIKAEKEIVEIKAQEKARKK